ncbi:MAG: DUF4430 domain-containing protein [Clostridiales bacterium]|nr:DUF4430 domain-containing protein [Roseburia sp.]MDD7636797.1 DUF4430 domain-containing protein [Clostridiales bacterium]MDY4113092.1 DUF4430 domain-containing protein [Roseburia sp.]
MSEKTNGGNKKKIILAVGALVLVAAIFAGVYFALAPKASAGGKEITIEVIDDAQASTVYEVSTDAEYLGDAIRETEGLTVEGTESEYGLMVDTVNGVVADYNENGAYWAFYVDGEYCMYGMDQQPIEDGQAYQIIYTAE